MNIIEILAKLVKKWDGPRLCITVAGGGIGLCDLAKIPGSSKIIEEISIPSAENLKSQTKEHAFQNWKHVSLEAIKKYFSLSCQKDFRSFYSGPMQHIVITSALTTFPLYEKASEVDADPSKNHAFIAIGTDAKDVKYYHICIHRLNPEEIEIISSFPYLMQETRIKEDHKITAAVVSLLLNDESLMPKWDTNAGEFCKEMPFTE